MKALTERQPYLMTDAPTYDDGTVRLPDAIERWLDGHFEGEKDDDGDLLTEWRNVTAVALWSLIYRRGDEENDQAAIDALIEETTTSTSAKTGAPLHVSKPVVRSSTTSATST